MRALIIEDDVTTAKSLELMLTSESFSVHSTDLGEEGSDLGKRYDYVVILIDLGLPDISGYDVIELRISKINTPILILSGTASIEEKVKGFGLGADDYVTKPFHRDELVARIQPLCAALKAMPSRSFRQVVSPLISTSRQST